MRTILNFLRLLPVFALAFFVGSIAVALLHSAAPMLAIPALLLSGLLAGWGCLLGFDDLNDY